ncbi:MAG: protein-L-isoaspartate(D-aspartate) O-methyltransferase [Pseudomonadota bacterium]
MTEDSEKARLLRSQMVESQILTRGVRHEGVVDALLRVPRHLFMAGHSMQAAYGDHAMPIGHGQTISQPYMVAIMTQLLVRSSANHVKVLEIGAGSGYQAAILSHLFEQVITIERIDGLARETSQRLRDLGYENVKVISGDGTLGYPPEAPYDAAMVTAAAPHLPSALGEQLGEEGAIVVPVGSRYIQQLEVYVKKDGRLEKEIADGCVFVPLIGEDGWEG